MSLPKLLHKEVVRSDELGALEELYLWICKETSLEDPEQLASTLIEECHSCLKNSDRKVRLLLASCMAQVLRLSIPSQPFPSTECLETVLLFILGQLAQGLQSLDIEERGLALNLLQTIASIRAFRLCSLIAKGQQLLASLLSLMIPIAEQAVVMERSLVLQLIRGVLDDPISMVDPKVLIPVAETIVTGPKTSLARALTTRGSEKHLGKTMSKLLIWLLQNVESKEKDVVVPDALQGLGVYQLVRELYEISPKLVQPAYQELGARLRSLDVTERTECFNIVTQILILDNATKTHPLFHHFLDRFSDVSLTLRMRCLHATGQLLQVHPQLLPDVVGALHQRATDTDNGVRCEVASVCTLIMLKNEAALELLGTLKTLTTDKECQLQVEAVKGMARVYKKYLTNHSDLTKSQKDAACMIYNTLMCHFFQDSTLISKHVSERILYSFLLPSNLPISKRMERLLFFLAGSDSGTVEAFQAMHADQKRRRSVLLKWLLLPPESKKHAIVATTTPDMRSCIPDLLERHWSLNALLTVTELNNSLLVSLISLLQADHTEGEMDMITEDLLDTVTLVYSENAIEIYKLKQFMYSLYKGLITRESLQILMQLIQQCLQNPSASESYGLNPQTVRENMFVVVKALAEPYGELLFSLDILQPLLDLISQDDSDAAASVLSILTALGADNPLESLHAELVRDVSIKCEERLFSRPSSGLSLSFVREVVRFVHTNLASRAQPTLANMFQLTRIKLDELPVSYRSPFISLLGYLAARLPVEHRPQLKATISRKVVKELLMRSCTSQSYVETTKFWFPDIELSTDVFCKVQGLRTMARWVLNAQNEDLTTIGNTLRMMDAFLSHKGDLLDEGTLSDNEKAVMRLEAGVCILKICRIKDALKQLTPSQIQNLCQLIMDDEPCVRERFAAKLSKGLCHMEPSCLPVLFVSILALGVLDPDPRLQQKAMHYIEGYFYCKSSSIGCPELCVLWLVPLLASAPCSWVLPAYQGSAAGWPVGHVSAQHRVRLALWSVLQPVILPQPRPAVARLENLLQKVKNCEDVLPTDTFSNQRLWTTVDLATTLIDNQKKSLSVLRKNTLPEVSPIVEPLPYNLLKPNKDPSFYNGANYVNFLFSQVPQLPHSEKSDDRLDETQADSADEAEEGGESTSWTTRTFIETSGASTLAHTS